MLVIPKTYVDGMISHSLEEDPNECCGILAGVDGRVAHLYHITNLVRSPNRYLMDPQQQLDAMLDSERRNWGFLAFYHSHTHSPAYPSSTDVRMALQSGYHEVYYILVSLEDKLVPKVRAFLIDETGVVAEEYFKVP